MKLEWMTTCPTGRSHTHGADCGQTGWRLHLVNIDACHNHLSRTEYGMFETPHGSAFCGLRPSNGWSLDLFISEPCARCEKRAAKLNIETPDYPK